MARPELAGSVTSVAQEALAALAKLTEKDPNKAVPLFWASGERIESALKDMATVLKQANWAEEAIKAIRSFRHRLSK
ncbi:hypothetical protein TRIUR3_34212 [Triticum urartu]|uniref:Uncharacterized protein n=1 Tax=Triticum urartu TaxID=4572 RepID=M7YEG6_TRIUA|nr:hypothetical protein TRIUR3_34212 [Triticum urartu]